MRDTMPCAATKYSNCISPSGLGHLSFRTHCYHPQHQGPPLPLEMSSRSPNIFPDAFKCPSPSLRLLSASSLNLVSLISKFEALDALSVPLKVPCLQPAPLELSRNSSTHRAGRGNSQQEKKNKNVAHRARSQTRLEHVSCNSNLPSTRENTVGTGTHAMAGSVKDPVPWKLKQHRSPCRYSSLKLTGQSPSSPHLGSGTIDQSPHDRKGPAARKRSTIKDRIRFFDGSMDNFIDNDPFHVRISSSAHWVPFIAPSTGSNTKAKPSLAPPRTPLSQKRPNDNPQSTRSTAHTNPKSSTAKSGTSNTSTERNHLLVSKMQNQIFGGVIPNPFQVQNPPIRLSTSTSARTSPKAASNRNYIDTKTEVSLIYSRPIRRNGTVSKDSNHVPSLKWETSPYCNRSQNKINAAANRKHLSVKHRQISDEIDALYCERSSATKRENSCGISLGQDIMPSVNKCPKDVLENGNRMEGRGDRRRGGSKVADMKSLFDGVCSEQSSRSFGPLSLPKAVASIVSTKKAREQDPPVATIPKSNRLKTSAVLPNTVQDMTRKKFHTTMSTFAQSAQFSHQILPNVKLQIEGSPTTKKIKRFEGRAKGKEEIEMLSTQNSVSLPKGMSRSMVFGRKTLFERIGRARSSNIGMNGLSGKNIQAVVTDEHNPDVAVGEGQEEKRKHAGMTNEMAFPSSHIIGGIAVQRARQRIDYPLPHGMEMIVKEAECGLKQPKPVRLTETKRMMLLCRGRVGGIVEKGQRSSAQSRKL